MGRGNMRVCLLSSGHKPNDDRIFFKEARSLAKRYDDVWVVSPYAEKVPLESYGVNFRSIPTHSRNLIGRFKTIRDLYSVGIDLNADVYHCHEPESLVVATKLKKKIGCKIIFDSHEMYSATLSQRFPAILRPYVMSAYQAFEKKHVRECNFAIGATWGISNYLASIVGEEKTESIFNGTLPEIFGIGSKKDWNEITLICHDGSLSFSRGLKTMVKAVELVRRQHQVKFRIVGDVFGREREWLESYIRSRQLDGMIERTGWLDYRDVGGALSACHIGLLALENLPNHIIAAPNKIFNYMHFGIPFIAPLHCTGIKRLIEDEKCGLTAQGGSAQSYADAIIKLIELKDESKKMGANAKRVSEAKYNWPIMERKLLNIYKRLCLSE